MNRYEDDGLEDLGKAIIIVVIGLLCCICFISLCYTL